MRDGGNTFEEFRKGVAAWFDEGMDRPNQDLVWTGFWYLVSRLPGWAVSVLAISLGAPLWFDTLSRLGQLRSTGAKPAKAGG